jgi:nucleoside-diphosphate-sugar epimerase
MKTAIVFGAGGFIGRHIIKRLKREGFWVRGVDLKFREYAETEANDFVRCARDSAYPAAPDSEYGWEKLCRQVAMAQSGDDIELWGDGLQTRSFLYVDECVEGTVHLTRSDFKGPVNIGSEEMVTINQLVDLVAEFPGKSIRKKHISGPLRVRGRNSDYRFETDWSKPLRGLNNN